MEDGRLRFDGGRDWKREIAFVVLPEAVDEEAEKGEAEGGEEVHGRG